jgi:7-carboxy-7-deazaguanine synthase
VELTGGEPLAQAGAIPLMSKLIADGYEVLLETGGSESIADVPADVHIIMDLKCPGSNMSERNHWPNLDHLKPTDEIKFVVASREDFEWSVSIIDEYKLTQRFQVLLSPAFGLVKPKDLVDWILQQPLPDVRLNLQLHKFIWHPRTKGV